MEEKEVEAQPIAVNEEVMNTILAFSQVNVLTLQISVKEFVVIKKNTMGKSKVKMMIIVKFLHFPLLLYLNSPFS